MKKFLKTVQLLFWGNVAVVAMAFYMLFVVLIQITMFFITSLGEIWGNEDNS